MRWRAVIIVLWLTSRIRCHFVLLTITNLTFLTPRAIEIYRQSDGIFAAMKFLNFVILLFNNNAIVDFIKQMNYSIPYSVIWWNKGKCWLKCFVIEMRFVSIKVSYFLHILHTCTRNALYMKYSIKSRLRWIEQKKKRREKYKYELNVNVDLNVVNILRTL